MTSQELGDALLHHWWNLWTLPAKERQERIAQIADDLAFEEALRLVKHEMECA